MCTPLSGARCFSKLTAFAVARIAYIASDLVLSVQPALGRDSEFSITLRSLAAKKAPAIVAKELPEV